MSEEQYKRSCPNCGKIMFYKNKTTKNTAIKKNTHCPKCAPKSGIEPVDLTGKKINRLTCVSQTYINYKNGKRTAWLCRCDCGEEKIIQTSSLQKGIVKSCGCYRVEKVYKGYEDLGGQQWSRIKHQAKLRKLEFNITIEEVYDLYLKQNKRCALSNIEIEFDRNYKGAISNNTASLDRIDSSRGYITGNIQWVHKEVNMMKGSLSDEDFIGWCKLIYFNFNPKPTIINEIQDVCRKYGV